MSHEILKSIYVKDRKVYVRSSSNNVSPRHYDCWECGSLTRILQEQGQEALDFEILQEYENGNFHAYPGTANKYTRALEALTRLPEYRNFTWRSYDEPYEAVTARRQSEEFKALLRKALQARLVRGQFVIKYPVGGEFLRKRGRRSAVWVRDQQFASVFDYREDADKYRMRFSGGDAWKVENIEKVDQYSRRRVRSIAA